MDKQESSVAFRLSGIDVLADGKDLLSLRAIWVATGSRGGKEPWRFASNPDTGSFIRQLAVDLKTDSRSLIVYRGPDDIWVHWQVAVKYAGFVSNAFQIAVGKAVKEWIEERRSPELKVDRAIGAWQAQGLPLDWIEERVRGRLQRFSLTSTQQSLGATKKGYAVVTEIGNVSVTGLTAKQIKATRKPKSGDTRDGCSKTELVALRLYEAQCEEVFRAKSAVGDEKQIGHAEFVGGAIKDFMQKVGSYLGNDAGGGSTFGATA